MLKGKIMIIVCMGCIMCSLMDTSMAYAKKWKPPVEKVSTWDDTIWVTRRKFGLVAKNVSSVELSECQGSLWNVYMMQNNTKIVKEVDLFHKKKGKQANYKLNTVSKKIKGYYPMFWMGC